MQLMTGLPAGDDVEFGVVLDEDGAVLAVTVAAGEVDSSRSRWVAGVIEERTALRTGLPVAAARRSTPARDRFPRAGVDDEEDETE